jgi:hypothetical protein
MSTHTKTDLRNDVLRELNVLPAGQTASAEDALLVESRIQSTLELLDAEGVIPWDFSASTIPNRAYLPLIPLVAVSLCGAYGQMARQPELEGRCTGAMRTLRRQAALPWVHVPTESDYY